MEYLEEIPEEITVITVDTEPAEDEYDRVRSEGAAIRAWRNPVEHTIKISELTQEINVLLAQIDIVLKDSKPSVGAFQFSEFEVSAGITASGKVSILGFGGEAGLEGGLKFVFKRS